MTTVAWDGKTLAADKQMTTGSMPHQSAFSKIRRGTYHGLPALFAQAGTTVFSSAVVDWLIAGMPGERCLVGQAPYARVPKNSCLEGCEQGLRCRGRRTSES